MTTILDVLVLTNCLVFLWAFVFFFRPAPSSSAILFNLTRLLGLLAVVSSIYISFATNDAPDYRSLPSLFLLVLSAIIFSSALITTHKTRLHVAFSTLETYRIVSGGPYRFIRHPFYSSYGLTWLAVAIYSANIYYIVLMFALDAIYIYAALQEELAFAKGEGASAYEEYKRTAGMFFPKMGGAR